jgi:hypothetical protein
MNRHLTELAFLLDRCGSMPSITANAIAHHLPLEQRRVPGQAYLTLTLFGEREAGGR